MTRVYTLRTSIEKEKTVLTFALKKREANRDKGIKSSFFCEGTSVRACRYILFSFFFVTPPPLHDRGSLHALPLNNPISRGSRATVWRGNVNDSRYWRIACRVWRLHPRNTSSRVLFSAFPRSFAPITAFLPRIWIKHRIGLIAFETIGRPTISFPSRFRCAADEILREIFLDRIFSMLHYYFSQREIYCYLKFDIVVVFKKKKKKGRKDSCISRSKIKLIGF